MNGPPAAQERKATAGPAYRIAALAARAIGVQDGTFVLVDGHLQGVLASTRSPTEPDGVAETLSELVATRARPLVVEDLATSDESALTGTEASGAFLGVPMTGPAGVVVGVLHVSSPAPRSFTVDDVELLSDLAAIAGDQLDLTRRANELEAPSERGAAALVHAIGRGEIVPWYQPIVDLATGQVIAVEALARWENPSGSVDDPAVFIPLAERSHLITDLDRVVIGQSLVDLSRWRAQHPGLRLSVNLSGRHLDSDDWVAVVQHQVAQAGVEPSAVTLELTETARPAGPGLSVERITQARAAGFQVWFDDFGSGWAALQELLSFPLDGIKIDRSFAAELGRHVDDTIVRAMAQTAGELGLKVTMEGVETIEQATIARELGCHYGQGYLWSRPVPALRVDRMLATADGQLPRLG
ncbi:EAL domain-containing protein [uncultured Friedmanniella sp.]|uniref:sensor domain-containing phosphodiesterase n=1 Tax=uncultured Friedmanniella sp. TaxID=335381 RepID=UPI0035CB5665